MHAPRSVPEMYRRSGANWFDLTNTRVRSYTGMTYSFNDPSQSSGGGGTVDSSVCAEPVDPVRPICAFIPHSWRLITSCRASSCLVGAAQREHVHRTIYSPAQRQGQDRRDRRYAQRKRRFEAWNNILPSIFRPLHAIILRD